MARKVTKALEAQGYNALDAYCIGLHEYYKSLRKAGFTVDNSLWILSARDVYPAWILPNPVDPDRFGDYKDEDDD